MHYHLCITHELYVSIITFVIPQERPCVECPFKPSNSLYLSLTLWDLIHHADRDVSNLVTFLIFRIIVTTKQFSQAFNVDPMNFSERFHHERYMIRLAWKKLHSITVCRTYSCVWCSDAGVWHLFGIKITNNQSLFALSMGSFNSQIYFEWWIGTVAMLYLHNCDDSGFMMTSSNGSIFRVTGHLCGEFTGHRWIPRTKATDAELWCFLWFPPE